MLFRSHKKIEKRKTEKGKKTNRTEPNERSGIGTNRTEAVMGRPTNNRNEGERAWRNRVLPPKAAKRTPRADWELLFTAFSGAEAPRRAPCSHPAALVGPAHQVFSFFFPARPQRSVGPAYRAPPLWSLFGPRPTGILFFLFYQI